MSSLSKACFWVLLTLSVKKKKKSFQTIIGFLDLMRPSVINCCGNSESDNNLLNLIVFVRVNICYLDLKFLFFNLEV